MRRLHDIQMEHEMNDLTIGIDLGGTKIEAALVGGDGAVHEKLREKTRVREGADAVVNQINDMIEKLTAKSDGNKPGALGIGLAGQIADDHDIVRSAPNLGWKDFPLQDKMKNRLDIPLNIDNDVRMAAYGEWQYGAGQAIDDLICIFVGTGVGGGIISEGRLIHGHNNTAGEIGHTTVNLRGPSCNCGNFGCLEAYAGGWAIARTAKQIIKKNEKTGAAILEQANNNIEDVTAESVAAAALNGNYLARFIMDQAAEALIAGCASLINIFSPRRIVFGGGVIDGYEELIETVERGISRRTLSAALSDFDIVKAELGSDAGVIGAAVSARRMIK